LFNSYIPALITIVCDDPEWLKIGKPEQACFSVQQSLRLSSIRRAPPLEQ